MKDHFLKLFHYDRWANQTLFQTVLNFGSADPEIMKLACHIVNAQIIWYGRVSGKKEYKCNVWEMYSADELLLFPEKSFRLWTTLISETPDPDLGKMIRYTNSGGKAFTTAASDIIIHVANHGTYHRAQIAKLLRQKNTDPPNTDYIHYSRLMTQDLLQEKKGPHSN